MTDGSRGRPGSPVIGHPKPQGYREAGATLTAPGGAFEVVVEDVLGPPMEVFAKRTRSLAELFAESARHGEQHHPRRSEQASDQRQLEQGAEERNPANRRFSTTESDANTALPPMSCTMPIRARSSGSQSVIVRPSSRTTPRVATPSPLITRSSVDLPAPLVPTRATVSLTTGAHGCEPADRRQGASRATRSLRRTLPTSLRGSSSTQWNETGTL